MSEHFSLSDCDVIGFDLDHTLCRYHLKEPPGLSMTVLPGILWNTRTMIKPADFDSCHMGFLF
uniref:5'-nucleotidase n=1 Tax=Anguilla anguilla TaxID=7936 RepID=A0A0E9T0W9_ANGAN